MNFNGQELKEITKPQIFDPPKKMLVWNKIMDYAITSLVVAIVERMDGICAICHDGEIYPYCAEIPEEPKPRRSTNRELAKWLAQGNGEVLTLMQMTNKHSYEIVASTWHYFCGEENKVVDYGYEGKCCKGIRKWEDTEWHEPTVDYMELEVVCRK